MAKNKKRSNGNTTEELLRKLLIVQLSIAKVPQKEIAKILGTSLSTVNAIAKYVKLPQ